MYKRLTTDVSGAHLLHLRREIPLDGPRLRAPHLLALEGLAHREPLAVPCLLPQPAQQPAARDPRQVAGLVHPLDILAHLAHPIKLFYNLLLAGLYTRQNTRFLARALNVQR